MIEFAHIAKIYIFAFPLCYNLRKERRKGVDNIRFIGEKLKHLRDTMGWSLQEVADRTGLNPSHVHEIEIGTRNPRPATLKKLTEGLHIAEQYFYLEDSALPVDVLPDMPDYLKKFLVNGTNIPWFKLAHDAKTKGISPESMEKILELMYGNHKQKQS